MLNIEKYQNSNDGSIVRVFPATDDSLADAQAFLEEQCDMNDASPKAAMQLAVAFEELFVNVAHYAYGEGSGDVAISIGVTDGLLTLKLIDSGVPFDPLAKDDPDITLSAEERRIGGLGIFMVKKTMDSIEYEFCDGMNVTTITKTL